MRHIVFRIVAALVFLAAVAGIAFFAYQAGVTHGSPITVQSPAGAMGGTAYPYLAYGMPWHFMPFFGFGCFGLLIPFILLSLAFAAFRRMMWGPRWGMHRMGYHGPWGEGGVPPMFNEWHKHAHRAPVEGGEPTEENKQ